ncbi:hypothetical protein BCR39DRAFT_558301 [Naematelia encephala]|uniref:Zn(2)-C6 fungal-type domain-containing protein n=1 Tax=Naematelia encephala TaxID=71784 RepID=A0A1Y2B8W5_9TREE|nr:hypothetical protein BCR39DRAFT_558301 [Naematelia encephala]
MSSQTETEPRKPPRKINRVLPQLKRNAACVPCRRRRIKCDAGKPHCSSCMRSFNFLARSNPDEKRDAKGVQCYYEDGSDDESSPLEEPAKKRKEPIVDDENPAIAVQRLEAEVAQLREALSHVTSSSNASTSPSDSRPLTTATTADSNIFPSRHYDRTQQSIPSGTKDSKDGLLSKAFDTSNHSLNAANGHNSSVSTKPAYTSVKLPGEFQNTAQPSAPLPSVENMDAEAGRVGGPFLDVFWPGWPPRLPTPALLDHLVYTFFSMVPSVPRLLHQTSFKARLALPPTHPDFPHPALLHAICCVTARYSAAVKVESVQESVERIDKSTSVPPGGPGRRTVEEEIAAEQCFAERNAKYASLEMRYDNPTGRRMFEILQAQVILGLFHQQTGRWLDGWLVVGQTVRSAIPLGLMNDEDPDDFHIPRLRTAVLPPPRADWEREERRLLIYYILANDASFSVSAAWPGSMMFDELTAKLPAAKADYDRGLDITENPQTYHSPDLFTNHPVSCSMIMLTKGMILLGRVSKLTRKLRLLPPAERVVAKQWPEAHKVDRDIQDLITTWPMHLRDPMYPLAGSHNRIDADLVCAHLVSRVAAIHLHEPFADLGDPQCPHSSRLLAESRAVLRIVYALVNSNTDVSFQMIPISSLWVFTAARTMLLFYHRALEQKDHQTAAPMLAEIEVFQMLFASMGSRFVMGAIHCGMIDRIVKHIHNEFGFPMTGWRWTPADWVQEGVDRVNDGVACPSQVGVDINLPTELEPKAPTQDLPLMSKNHPDGMAWGSQGTSNWKYRDIADQQRGYLGRSQHAPPQVQIPIQVQPQQPRPPQLQQQPRLPPLVSPHVPPHVPLSTAIPRSTKPSSYPPLPPLMNPISSGGMDFGALSMGNHGIGLGRDDISGGLEWLDWGNLGLSAANGSGASVSAVPLEEWNGNGNGHYGQGQRTGH